MAKPKISKGFSNILFIVANIGMVSLILKFFGIIDYDQYIVWVTSVLFGLGMIIESQIRMWFKMAKKGLTTIEMAHIVTGVVGVMIFLSGLIGLFKNELPAQLQGIIGFAYIIALIMTWIERFV